MYEHMDKSKVAKKAELKKYQDIFFQTIEGFEFLKYLVNLADNDFFNLVMVTAFDVQKK
jgi:hypothetical protein